MNDIHRKMRYTVNNSTEGRKALFTFRAMNQRRRRLASTGAFVWGKAVAAQKLLRGHGARSHDSLCTVTLTLYQTMGQCFVHKWRLNTVKRKADPAGHQHRWIISPLFFTFPPLGTGGEIAEIPMLARGPAGSEPSRAAALLKSHKGAAAKPIMALADELGAACLAVTLQIAL